MAQGKPGTVPIVDISAFALDEDSRSRTAESLNRALRSNGCVGLINHAVSEELIGEAFKRMKLLFDLPYDDKMKAPHPKGFVPHRGYSGAAIANVGRKTALEIVDEASRQAMQQIKDHKETYEIGSEENLEHYNIWLSDGLVPDFRHSSLKLYWHLHQAAENILNALAVSLRLTASETDAVLQPHTGHENQLRYLHYPKIYQPGDHISSRQAMHSDWSLFTFFFQDDCGGLQFLDRESGEYFDVAPKPEVIYLCIGDMFERVSNGTYPATKHRVVAPNSSDDLIPERYSMVYFVSPAPNAVIAPQKTLVLPETPSLYEPTSFKEISDHLFKVVRGPKN